MMCLSLQNTSSVGVYDVVQDNSPGEMTMEEPLSHKGNTHHYMHSMVCMIYYTCVIIDKVEKTGLVCSFIPAGCGEGISGTDVSKVKYEEITDSRNKLVC